LKLAGVFLSGHPLDKYRAMMERSATVNSETAKNILASRPPIPDNISWKEKQAMRENGARYIAIGKISGLREITTKKGDQMAFATLEDLSGGMDCAFFPKSWETMKNEVANDKVLAFRGSIDKNQNGEPSFHPEELLDLEHLPEKTWREMHIRLDDSNSEKTLLELREKMLGYRGGSTVFFHWKTHGVEHSARAAIPLNMLSTEAAVDALKSCAGVEEIWRA
jgi:DNA polymerase-3 subunit alpha